MAGHQSHQGYAEIEDTFRSTQEQAETPQPDQLELLLAVELHCQFICQTWIGAFSNVCQIRTQ